MCHVICNLDENVEFTMQPICYYRPQTKLRESDVFAQVCVSTGGLPSHNAMGRQIPCQKADPAPEGRPNSRQIPYLRRQTPSQKADPSEADPQKADPRNAINWRAVPILLECILVSEIVYIVPKYDAIRKETLETSQM